MNCDITRRRLLAAERPDAPDAAVRQHLAGCPSCRGLQRRVVEVEQSLPLLPVPPPSGPAATLQLVLRAPFEPSLPVPIQAPRPPSPWGPRTVGRQKVAVAFALAAALAVFAVGWWAWPHQQASSSSAR